MIRTQLLRAATLALSLALVGTGLTASPATAASITPGSHQASRIPVTVVNATLSDDMRLTLDRTSVPAGYVEFLVQNAGATTHELVVLETSVSADKLPANPEEAAKALEKVHMGETGDLAAGHFSGLALALGAGHYVVLCNEPGHYMAGMRVDFEVTAPVVNVSLADNMSITLDQSTVFAGPIVFAVSNLGSITHELVILNTNMPADQMPTEADDPAKVSEETNIGETGDIPAGRFSGIGITLPAGQYLVICNEPGHFASGMRFVLTVLAAPGGDEPDSGN